MIKLAFGIFVILLLSAVMFLQADMQIRADGATPVYSPAEGLGMGVVGGIGLLIMSVLAIRAINPILGKKLLKGK
jgi:hypothetical protein